MFGRSAVSDVVHMSISKSDTLTHLNTGQSSTGNIYNDLCTLHTIRTRVNHTQMHWSPTIFLPTTFYFYYFMRT